MPNYKQITLSDPNAVIPDLVLKGFGDSGYQRSPVNRVISSGRTLINIPKLGQRPGNYSYFQWSLSAGVTIEEANLFVAYLELSDERWGNNADGHILLIDEYQPVRQRGDRTLVSGLNFTESGQNWGYGIFKILLIAPQNPRQYLSGHLEQIQFDCEELPA